HQVVIDMGNGYYSMTGLLNYGELSYDPYARVHATDFNSQANVDALQGFIDIIQPKKDKGFKSVNADDILTDFSDANGNKVVAAVTGNWNVDNLKEELGDNFAAAKLPTYTSADSTVVQMGSFSGSKLVGVKSSSLVSAWALAFAEFVTNEASQLYRFEAIAKGPTNSVVYNSDAVVAEPGLAALDDQALFSIPQGKSVGGSYWSPAGSVGNFIVNGPASVDGPQTIQEQLDAFVAAITAAPEA
ncbi:MAG: extracellular solute-binding protein, partial [Methanomicrobia archaeon]|nr:extracellular solute-binding protein [Methanomicrobia archaeon]